MQIQKENRRIMYLIKRKKIFIYSNNILLRISLLLTSLKLEISKPKQIVLENKIYSK